MADSGFSKKGVRPERLNDKHQMFISYYTTHWDATEAAREVGYKHPGPAAARLLKHPLIKKAIANVKHKIATENKDIGERVMEALEYAAFQDPIDGPLDLNKLNELPPSVRQWLDVKAKQRVDGDGVLMYADVEVQFCNPMLKLAAIRELIKIRGMYAAEKHEIGIGNMWDEYYSEEPVPDKLKQRLLELKKEAV